MYNQRSFLEFSLNHFTARSILLMILLPTFHILRSVCIEIQYYVLSLIVPITSLLNHDPKIILITGRKEVEWRIGRYNSEEEEEEEREGAME